MDTNNEWDAILLSKNEHTIGVDLWIIGQRWGARRSTGWPCPISDGIIHERAHGVIGLEIGKLIEENSDTMEVLACHSIGRGIG